MANLTRRNVLRGAAALAGGIGLAEVGNSAAKAASPEDESTFTLFGSSFKTNTKRSRQVGEQFVVSGSLAQTLDGPVAGTFAAHAVTVARHDLLDAQLGTIETQTFVLATGTLVGTGTASHHGEGSFAIVGGTGAFHGVYGSYTVSQPDVNVDGRAIFTFTLSTREASQR